MNRRYVYIDETGDLGEKGSKYFIITAIWTRYPEKFDRLIKNLRRYKFKKQLKKAIEIKANKSSDELRIDILKKLRKINDFHAHSIVLNKEKVYSQYLKGDKHKLYNYVCGNLTSNLNIDSKHLEIRVDRSKGKQALQNDFNRYIINKCRENCWNRKIDVFHSGSHSWSGLQLVDVVSWVVFQKFENNNDSYLKIIEDRININHVWK